MTGQKPESVANLLKGLEEGKISTSLIRRNGRLEDWKKGIREGREVPSYPSLLPFLPSFLSFLSFHSFTTICLNANFFLAQVKRSALPLEIYNQSG
jgi:hypothetical protein